ncbi:hypothetical protein [Marinobacter sp.]|uniref:hypothetical protein n=1 Tax=Marinobacter sp. TaxID=50741 RepID=UPI00257BB10F|nr:hypothetical protein [Marinobacter sp.]
MAEVKNSFLSSKMNKDLDDRLVPNGEYRNAVNISINKSTGENVGTAQTVLGNEKIINFSVLGAGVLEVIGVFPDEASNTIYALLTNNTIKPYVPTGAIGNNSTYPNNQNSITGGPIEITAAGATYTDEIDGSTTAITGSGSGLTVSVTVDGSGGVTEAVIQTFGSGYAVNDVIQINGGNSAARLTVKSLLPNDHFIVAYNITTTNLVTICQGPFLNFSTLFPVTGINLLEELLFFTDNRNQPRKINITRTTPYYTTEDQISVAKYYPYETIELYQPSSVAGAIIQSETTNVVSNSNIITFNPVATGIAPTTSLGVTGTAATLLSGGLGYAVATNVATTGGSGGGLTINILTVGASGQPIATFEINNNGVGYNTGDVVTVIQGSSSNTAELTISVVKENTFITSVANWPNEITVSQTQDLPAGTSIQLSEPETTLKDAISEFLPVEADAGGTGNFSIISPTNFQVTKSSYVGDADIVGATIFLQNASGNYVNTGITVISQTTSGVDFNIVASASLNPFPEYAANAVVKFAIPNPYFDQVFKDNANVDFLSDKFVRFSYRYKFDDGEYSLMAPFTQPCFIPEQDGYFKSAAIGVDEVSDSEKAYRSTEVSFMENKVNKILLNIPLPSSANSLNTDFKVTEIDILYKESDQTTIKVVDSVPILANVQGTSEYYQYEYGSKPPFKTLPQSDTVRVFDKIPVKALSQEIASNRIIYGNFQDKHTPPSFLNYTLATGAKGVIGAATTPKFTITDDEVTNYTSIIEYPNGSLKENRTYEVGVVLADRFGRQSTVLFSRTKLSLQPSFIASSTYSPYRSLADNESTSSNPTGGILNFDGDSLKIQFIDIINSFKNETTGTPGLYNGDPNSQEYNPLGWYSFKIVVKQTEQEYYNVYIPTAMAAYPLDNTKEINTTSHIVLYNDNINKVPRDLTEVGPTQREFPSSVRMFGRVNNPTSLGGRPSQFYPGRAASLSTTIATIKDLFDFEEFPVLAANEYVFYNYDYTGGAGASAGTNFTTSDGSSLIARIESSNDTKFGLQLPASGVYGTAPGLNVFETAPTVSLIDIYYETSTAGRIDLLNKAVAQGPAANIFTQVTGLNWLLNEGFEGLNSASPAQRIATTPFIPQDFNGANIGDVTANVCEIISVTNQLGDTTNEDGVLFHDPANISQGIFGVEQVLDAGGVATGFFRIVLTKAGNTGTPVDTTPGLVVTGGNGNTDSYTYTFNLRFDNDSAEEPFDFEFNAVLGNIPPPPACNPTTPAPGAIEVRDIDGNKSYPCCCTPGGCATVFIPPTVFDLADGIAGPQFGPLFGITCLNGSKTNSLSKLGMTFTLIALVETINGVDVLYNTQAEIETRFTISQGPGPAGIPALTNVQAVISVPQQNNLSINTRYALTIQACDAGSPNLCEQCEIIFEFGQDPVISYDGGATYSIVNALSNPRSNFINYDICQNLWWEGPSITAPTNAQQLPNGFLTTVLTKWAPVKMTMEYEIYNSAGSTVADIAGDVRFDAIFNDEGNGDIANFPTLATASVGGVYPAQDGVFFIETTPLSVPPTITGATTNDLTLPVLTGQTGWGQTSSGATVLIKNSSLFFPGFEECISSKRPVVRMRLKAELP